MLPTELTTIEQIQKLAMDGFDDWHRFGSVKANYNGDLLLLNYTRDAYDTWNWFETVSRGLILNWVTGEVVARPFDRFFNWLEGGRKAGGHIASITEKLDGSLSVLYRRTDGKFRVATRRRFTSDQAEVATDILYSKHADSLARIPDELTLMFEVIYPENRIVVDYGGTEDLFLIGARNRFTGERLRWWEGLYDLSQLLTFPIPKFYNFNNISEIIEATDSLDANHEGWVVEFSDGSLWKFKGDQYLEVHRLISRINTKRVLESLVNGTTDEIEQKLPENIVDTFTDEVDRVLQIAATIDHSLRMSFVVAPKDSRKEFALWARDNVDKDLQKYMFFMLDGKYDLTKLFEDSNLFEIDEEETS